MSPIKPALDSGVVHARITAYPILGTSAASTAGTTAGTATGAVPSRDRQIRVLTRVLRRMRNQYARFSLFTPGPQDIFDYGIGSLWRRGVDGAGTTVALIEGWDDPQIGSIVARFDRMFGLPAPKIKTIYPAGPLPGKCPRGMAALRSYGSCRGWHDELTLDVLSVHLIAPYARILISATPADTEIKADAAQQVAPPEMMKAIEFISRHHLASAISISDGTGEGSYKNGRSEILAQTPGELTAAAAGIPVLNATGDCGVVQALPKANGPCPRRRETATWDDSPWVTAVGGSVPNVSPRNGRRRGPDFLWHEKPPRAQYSEGAGFSAVFSRPAYQRGVAAVPHFSMRSVPDITMDAQVGTSEAAPLLGGLMALATQMNHGDLGPINPVLYRVLGPAGRKDGIADVVKGDNSAETSRGRVKVPGFVAKKGFDVASGWGTVFAPRFVPALVAATRASRGESAARHQARSQLISLEQAIRLSRRRVSRRGRCYLQASGFLPHYPVRLRLGTRAIATLWADALGQVTYAINPAQLGLRTGKQRITLMSMLISKSASLRVG